MDGIRANASLLRKLRKLRGLTQLDLALVAGVSERTVRNAECGKAIRIDFLSFLAVALGVEVADVAHDSDELRLSLRNQSQTNWLLEPLLIWTSKHDRSAFRSIVSPNVLIRSLGPDQIPFAGEYRGLDGFQTFFDRSAQAVDHIGPSEILETRSSGNLVIMEGIDHLRAHATGKLFKVRWLSIAEFEKGRLVRLDSMLDYANTLIAVDAYSAKAAEHVTVRVNRSLPDSRNLPASPRRSRQINRASNKGDSCAE